MTFMENGILVEKKIKPVEETPVVDDPTDPTVVTKAAPAKKRRIWQPHNIAEYFFFNQTG